MQRNNQNGFTMIEIAFYIAVLLFIILTLFNIFNWGIQANRRIKVTRENIAALRHVSDVLHDEISNASSIYYPTNRTNQLSIQTNHNVPTGEKSAYVDLYACGFNICRKRDGQPAETLLPDSLRLSNLVFTVLNSSSTPSVKVDLGLRSTQSTANSLNDDTMDTSITVSLRSY